MSRKSKVLTIATVLGLILLLTVTLIPLGIERYVERWLAGQGLASRDLEDVDLNLFAGMLRFDVGRISGAAGERGEIGMAELNFHWTGLFGRNLMLSSFTLRDARVEIRKLEDGRYSIGGLIVPFTNGTDEGPPTAEETPGELTWGFGISEVTLENVELAYQDELLDSQLRIRRLTLDRVASWEPDSPTSIAAELEVDGAPLTLQAELLPFAPEPAFDAAVTLERLGLGAYASLLETTGISEVGGELSLELHSQGRLQVDGDTTLSVAGTVSIEKLRTSTPVATLQNDRIHWSGDFLGTLPAGAQDSPAVSGTGDILVNGFVVDAAELPIQLLAFEQLALSDVNVSDLKLVSIEQVSLNGLEVARHRESDQVLLAIADTQLDGIQLADLSKLEVGSVRVDTLVGDLLRREDGELAVLGETLAAFGTAPPEAGGAGEPIPAEAEHRPQDGAAKPAADSDQPFGFHVAKFQIGGDSRVAVQDRAVSPPFATQIHLDEVLIEKLGNIDPTVPARISLALRQGDTANLTVSGEVWAFGDLASNLELHLKSFDLTNVSTYAPAYHIQRGRLSVDTTAQLVNDTLDVKNALVIEKLKLSGKSGGEQSMVGTGMAMPLDVALDLLRDSEDRIKLDVPITGSLRDPQFGTGDIMRLAMQGALQKAAMAYAKNALQPLGTIMLVASVAGKAARPRFEPLTFAAGLTEITPESAEYLSKIATLLEERPGLSLTFCGVSTLGDRDYLLQVSEQAPAPAEAVPEGEAQPLDNGPLLESERLELAQARGNAVQNYFVTRHGIATERLFRCRPMLDSERTDPPRVEIML